MRITIFLLAVFFTASLHASERLNVVMLEVDDLNCKNLGYMGPPSSITAHLDKLAVH